MVMLACYVTLDLAIQLYSCTLNYKMQHLLRDLFEHKPLSFCCYFFLMLIQVEGNGTPIHKVGFPPFYLEVTSFLHSSIPLLIFSEIQSVAIGYKSTLVMILYHLQSHTGAIVEAWAQGLFSCLLLPLKLPSTLLLPFPFHQLYFLGYRPLTAKEISFVKFLGASRLFLLEARTKV